MHETAVGQKAWESQAADEQANWQNHRGERNNKWAETQCKKALVLLWVAPPASIAPSFSRAHLQWKCNGGFCDIVSFSANILLWFSAQATQVFSSKNVYHFLNVILGLISGEKLSSLALVNKLFILKPPYRTNVL